MCPYELAGQDVYKVWLLMWGQRMCWWIGEVGRDQNEHLSEWILYECLVVW